MKRNPGRWIISIIFMAAVLSAAPYRWSASVSQKEAYLHEAVELRYLCRFDGTGALYTIDFDPPRETAAYRLKLLHESERIEGGHRINEYRFLLFPLETGKMELEFPVLMRRTTQESIENTVIGRDNVEELDFSDTAIRTPKLALDVKGHGMRLVGSYAMEREVSATEVRAYEPLHVTVTVTGEGNLDKLQPFTLEIPGAEVFSEPPERNFERSDKGLRGRWVQRFAVVASEDFILPELTLDYFDTGTKKPEKIVVPAKPIRVSAVYRPETLLDTAEEKVSWQWEWGYLYYLLTFVSGFLIGKWGGFGAKKERGEGGFESRVRAAKTHGELAVVLAMRDDPRFENLIEALEEEQVGLAEAKRKALKQEKR
jgi:hypothetical protein